MVQQLKLAVPYTGHDSGASATICVPGWTVEIRNARRGIAGFYKGHGGPNAVDCR